jgi:hypothetical protein
MRIYKCRIEYERTGVTCYDGILKDGEIDVRAKNVLDAYKKALHYRKTGEVKKVVEVYSVEYVSEIDKE